MAIDYNRQYVGARYVPKFFENPDGSWDWAAGFQYEPLTIVKYGENTYTSKKLVPDTIGSPNLNLDYWANTGNYNGYIQLINQEIQELQIRTNLLDSKKIVIFSDSYGMVNPSGYNWPDYIGSFIPNSTIYNQSISGAGFIVENPTLRFSYILNNYNISNPSQITDFILAAGYNDALIIQSNPQEIISLRNAISDFAIAVKQKFINAKLWIGYLPWETELNLITKKNADGLISTRNGYNYLFNNRMNYIPNIEYTLHDDSLLDNSGYHPNISGSQHIANNIAQAINGMTPTVYYYDTIPVTSNFSYTGNWERIIENGYETIRGNNIAINNITLSKGVKTDIFTLSEKSTILDSYSLKTIAIIKSDEEINTVIVELKGNVIFITPNITVVSKNIEISEIIFNKPTFDAYNLPS